MIIHICSNKIYEYNGWLFECGPSCGLWPLKKNFDPRKRAGIKFFKDVSGFLNMPDEKKRKYHVAGGCERFESGETTDEKQTNRS